MKEILLTSSVLILALLGLRLAFRQRISCRVRYALWALVLVRLLIPINLPAAGFSVLSVSQPARTEVAARLEENDVYVLPLREDPISYSSVVWPRWTDILPIEGHPVVSADEKTLVTYAFTLEEALDLVWKAGMGCMALWLLVSNLRFRRMLMKCRIPLEFPDCRRPVYLVEEGLASPCLFGLFRPAIYLTPAALEDRDGLRHVLAHEEAHARQGDPLWSLLRGVCLAVYWFDPLVWLAARAAREDCELSCDELALKALGEGERVPYGRTLLRLIPVKGRAGDALLTATTMTSSKKRLKERITRIAENRKMKRAALCAALAVTVAVGAMTFTGCVATVPKDAPDAPSDVPAAPKEPAEPVNDAAPVLTIPLADLPSYAPIPVEVLPADALLTGHHGEGHHGEYADRYRAGGGCHTTEHCGTFAWSCGGNTYVSSHDLRLSSYPSDYFLCFPEQPYEEAEFTDLFGYDGVMISYYGAFDGHESGAINDYYIFEESGSGSDVYLLARMYGEPQLIDLDGDGTMELASSTGWDRMQLMFQQDGELYYVDVGQLVPDEWPGLSSIDTCGWDAEERCGYLAGFVPSETAGDGFVYTQLLIRFDGEHLLLGKPVRTVTDHILSSVQAPAAVLDAAREAARQSLADVSALRYGGEDAPAVWDDYRVTDLYPAYPGEADQLPEGLALEVYACAAEVHTATPERIFYAGGVYMDEADWVGGFQECGCHLVFQRLEDGGYICLGSLSGDTGAGSPVFLMELNELLAENRLPQIPVDE